MIVIRRELRTLNNDSLIIPDDKLGKLISPIDPYNLVKIVSGVSIGKVNKSLGLAEVVTDSKLQGKYMTICKVIKGSSKNDLGGAYVLVWSSAIEEFTLPDNKLKICLVRDVDIFATIDYNMYENLSESEITDSELFSKMDIDTYNSL
jgi:hypothetical protein